MFGLSFISIVSFIIPSYPSFVSHVTFHKNFTSQKNILVTNPKSLKYQSAFACLDAGFSNETSRFIGQFNLAYQVGLIQRFLDRLATDLGKPFNREQEWLERLEHFVHQPAHLAYLVEYLSFIRCEDYQQLMKRQSEMLYPIRKIDWLLAIYGVDCFIGQTFLPQGVHEDHRRREQIKNFWNIQIEKSLSLAPGQKLRLEMLASRFVTLFLHRLDEKMLKNKVLQRLIKIRLEQPEKHAQVALLIEKLIEIEAYLQLIHNGREVFYSFLYATSEELKDTGMVDEGACVKLLQDQLQKISTSIQQHFSLFVRRL